jgi:VWFA-related protein
MRLLLLLGSGLILLAVLPAAARESRPAPQPIDYAIDIDPHSIVTNVRGKPGSEELFITLDFKIRYGKNVEKNFARAELELFEDKVKIDEFEMSQPRMKPLTSMLVIDVSGSMKNNNKIDQARKAAQTYLNKLDNLSDSGLILFDHEIPLTDPNRVQRPSGKPESYKAHRDKLRAMIDKAEPLGGTAYLDATAEAVEMLRNVQGRKAVLLLTDGVDMSSKRKIEMVVALAKEAHVPVYTLGVGEPGKNEKVTTVLVLDHSGSMRAKANDKDTKTKMQALRQAATRFVELMRPTAQTTLLPFSSTVESPSAFSSDRKTLKMRISHLNPDGGTLLYDATLAGVETLRAARLTGRKFVVVLTDGKDESPGSRVSDDEVIERAKEENIPLYMLGLGRRKDINEKVMRRMAEDTGGKYYHAENEAALIRIFEQLSIDLHDDGIDEESLQRLAKETGGKYYPARDASKLGLIYEELAEELQSSYTVTFKSRKQTYDGAARGIQIRVVRDGQAISTGGSGDYTVPGVVVVPDMNQLTYVVLFVFLAGLGALLALPAAMSKQGRAKQSE